MASTRAPAHGAPPVDPGWRWRAVLGAGLGGVVAGALNGSSIALCRMPWIAWSSLGWIGCGAVHGAVLGMGVGAVLSRPRWLGRGPLGLLAAYGAGAVAGLLGALPFLLLHPQVTYFAAPGVTGADALMFSFGLGGPVCLGVALGHVTEALRPRRTSPLYTLAVAAACAGLGALPFWYWKVARITVLAGLVHGTLFGLCVVLGMKFLRHPTQAAAGLRLGHPALGAMLGGAVAGAVNGASLWLAIPYRLAREVPARVIAEGAFHGAVLGLAVAIGVFARGGWGTGSKGAALGLLRVAAVGAIGNALGFSACALIEGHSINPWLNVDLGALLTAPALSFGAAVAVGLALGHVPEILRPERASGLLTLFLASLGAGLGATAFWCGFGRDLDLRQSVAVALCHGYAFGVCWVLGTKLFRRFGPDTASRPRPTAPPARSSGGAA